MLPNDLSPEQQQAHIKALAHQIDLLVLSYQREHGIEMTFVEVASAYSMCIFLDGYQAGRKDQDASEGLEKFL